MDTWVEAKRRLDTCADEVGNRDIAFSIYYWGATPNHRDNCVHRHSYFEVCYVVEGEGDYWEEDIRHPLRPGTLICTRPGISHRLSSQGMFLIYVAFEGIEHKSSPDTWGKYEALKRAGKSIIPECESSSPVQLWHALFEMATCGKPMREAISSTIHALLVALIYAFQHDACEEPPVICNQNEAYMTKAARFIRNNLSKPLRLGDVARYLHLSNRHLSRLFSDTVGQSFSEYVRRERLRQAEELLVNTNAPLKEIVQESGFQSIHHFTRVFGAYKGMPPGKYRDIIRKRA